MVVPPVMSDKSTELPPDIVKSVPERLNDCGTSPTLPPLPAPVGAETHVEPFQVSTSPRALPDTVRLSAKIAVPWNLSPYTSLNRNSALPISHVLSTEGALCPSSLI